MNSSSSSRAASTCAAHLSTSYKYLSTSYKKHPRPLTRSTHDVPLGEVEGLGGISGGTSNAIKGTV
jgi:hypothetical protein